MPLATHPPEPDLFLPLPSPGERWDPHTIHTHYFGFCVPEAALGAFIYIRYHPAFPLSGAGVLLYSGLDGHTLSDSLFHDYQLTLPWPEIDGNVIRTANGLTVDFTEPGRRAHLTFESADGEARFDIDALAVSGLAA